MPAVRANGNDPAAPQRRLIQTRPARDPGNKRFRTFLPPKWPRRRGWLPGIDARQSSGLGTHRLPTDLRGNPIVAPRVEFAFFRRYVPTRKPHGAGPRPRDSRFNSNPSASCRAPGSVATDFGAVPLASHHETEIQIQPAKPPRLADVPPAEERRADRATIKLCALALKLQPADRPAIAPFAQPPEIQQISIHWRLLRRG